MRLEWDPSFAEEAARFKLCYTCQDCVYFLPVQGACAHGWPICDQLATHDAALVAEEVIFCKEHEIF